MLKHLPPNPGQFPGRFLASFLGSPIADAAEDSLIAAIASEAAPTPIKRAPTNVPPVSGDFAQNYGIAASC